MYVYRNEIYNRRGYIHKLYRAEMSALYKGNSQGYFCGIVYGVKHILSTMPNLYTTFTHIFTACNNYETMLPDTDYGHHLFH